MPIYGTFNCRKDGKSPRLAKSDPRRPKKTYLGVTHSQMKGRGLKGPPRTVIFCCVLMVSAPLFGAIGGRKRPPNYSSEATPYSIYTQMRRLDTMSRAMNEHFRVENPFNQAEKGVQKRGSRAAVLLKKGVFFLNLGPFLQQASHAQWD